MVFAVKCKIVFLQWDSFWFNVSQL